MPIGPIKAVRELGSERRETVRSLSGAGVRYLRGAVLSTRGPGLVAGIVSDVTSYTIRHSFAMSLKEQNVPIEMISELLGHKSIKTTQIYLRSFSLEKMTVVNKSCFENVYNYMPEVG